MNAVLIYDNGYEHEPDIQIKEFESTDKMIAFINEENIGNGAMAAYEFYKEIEIEPFEKVLNYKIKES